MFGLIEELTQAFLTQAYVFFEFEEENNKLSILPFYVVKGLCGLFRELIYKIFKGTEVGFATLAGCKTRKRF